VIEGEYLGAKAVIDHESGYVAGELPSEMVADVLADARILMQHEKSRALGYGDTEVFIETVAPQPHLVVFGAVEVAQPLSTMARLLGFQATISDAGAAFATGERFPDADRVLVGWPDQLKDLIELDHRTYVVLLSHDARFEDPVLPWVLSSPASTSEPWVRDGPLQNGLKSSREWAIPTNRSTGSTGRLASTSEPSNPARRRFRSWPK